MVGALSRLECRCLLPVHAAASGEASKCAHACGDMGGTLCFAPSLARTRPVVWQQLPQTHLAVSSAYACTARGCTMVYVSPLFSRAPLKRCVGVPLLSKISFGRSLRETMSSSPAEGAPMQLTHASRFQAAGAQRHLTRE